MTTPPPVAASDLSAVIERLEDLARWHQHIADVRVSQERNQRITDDLRALLASHRSLTEAKRVLDTLRCDMDEEDGPWPDEAKAELDAWEEKWNTFACSSAYANQALEQADRAERKVSRLTAELAEARGALEPTTDWLLDFARRYSAAKDETSIKALAWNISGAFRERALTPATIPEEEAKR